MYYIFIKDNKLWGSGECRVLNESFFNAEVPEELYLDYNANPQKYIAGTKEIDVEVQDYDENNNPVLVQYDNGEVKPKTHIETITIPYPILNPNYEEEKLTQTKAAKYEEAKTKAYSYLESGEALYEFEEGKHIEATDGNIAKFTAYALGFMSGSTTPVVWSTKEDETVVLEQEQVVDILQGLGAVQAQVWTVKFADYITEINEAETTEDVEAITIDYSEQIIIKKKKK